MHIRSHDQGGLCPGDLCTGGVFVWGSLCPGGSLSRGFYPGGLCPGGSVFREGLCPKGFLSRGSLSGAHRNERAVRILLQYILVHLSFR